MYQKKISFGEVRELDELETISCANSQREVYLVFAPLFIPPPHWLWKFRGTALEL
jgi:hypothetical protein